MKTLHLVGCIVGLAVAPACYLDFGDGSRDVDGWSAPEPSDPRPTPPPPTGGSEPDWGYTGDGILDVSDATLAGPMGSVHLVGGVYESSGQFWGTSMQVTMYARGRGGEAMGLITIDSYGGDLSFHDGDRFSSAESTAVFVSGLGCSGESRGAWVFDESPEQTDVEVRAGDAPNQRRLDYSMRFRSGDVVSGSFVIVVDPETGTVAE